MNHEDTGVTFRVTDWVGEDSWTVQLPANVSEREGFFALQREARRLQAEEPPKRSRPCELTLQYAEARRSMCVAQYRTILHPAEPPCCTPDGAHAWRNDRELVGVNLEPEREDFPRRFPTMHPSGVYIEADRIVTVRACPLCGAKRTHRQPNQAHNWRAESREYSRVEMDPETRDSVYSQMWVDAVGWELGFATLDGADFVFDHYANRRDGLAVFGATGTAWRERDWACAYSRWLATGKASDLEPFYAKDAHPITRGTASELWDRIMREGDSC